MKACPLAILAAITAMPAAAQIASPTPARQTLAVACHSTLASAGPELQKLITLYRVNVEQACDCAVELALLQPGYSDAVLRPDVDLQPLRTSLQGCLAVRMKEPVDD